MRKILLALVLAVGACGGGTAEETGPAPLKYKFDDDALVSIPPEQQPDVLTAKQDWDVSSMTQKKAKSDLANLQIQLHQAQNEAKAQALLVDSAKEEKAAAGKTVDMTRQANASKALNTAMLGKNAADAKVTYYQALLAAQSKLLLADAYDVTAKEAKWQLEKAKVAQANNFKPSGFEEQNFEKQYTERLTRSQKVKGDADKMTATAEDAHKKWQGLQDQVDGAKGADAAAGSNAAPPPPPSTPTATNPPTSAPATP